MATDTTTPGNTTATAPSRMDQFIEKELGQTSSRLRVAEFVRALLVTVAWALALLLLLVIVDSWIVPLGSSARMAGLIILLGGAGVLFCLGALPLLVRRINPHYVARMIEHSGHSFHNSLLNYLLLRNNREVTRRTVFEAVSHRAATDLSGLDENRRVDFSGPIRMGFVVAGLVALLVGYIVFSPKNPWTSLGRILLPGARIAPASVVTVFNVQPGDTTLFFGERLPVTCDVRGLRSSDSVRLVYSSRDGQIDSASIPMQPAPDDGNRWTAEIACEPHGISTDLEYFITAGDGTSPTYQVAVKPNPTITVKSVEIAPPLYTRLPPSQQTGRGEIRAPEGSTVTIHAASNQDIKLAWIELVRAPAAGTVAANSADIKVTQTVSMMTGASGRDATGEFQLLLNRNSHQQEFTHYRLRFRTPADQRNEMASLHPVQIIPDAAPEISIVRPGQNSIDLPINGTLPIEIHAADIDYEISDVQLVIDQRGNRMLDQTLQLPQDRFSQQVISRYDLHPATLNLEVGDQVVFFAKALDNRTSPLSGLPDPNTSVTANYTVRITAADPNAPPPTTDQPPQQDSTQSDPMQSPDAANPDQQSSPPDENQPPDDNASTGDNQSGENAAGNSRGGDNNSDSDNRQPGSNPSDPNSPPPDSGKPDPQKNPAGDNDPANNSGKKTDPQQNEKNPDQSSTGEQNQDDPNQSESQQSSGSDQAEKSSGNSQSGNSQSGSKQPGEKQPGNNQSGDNASQQSGEQGSDNRSEKTAAETGDNQSGGESGAQSESAKPDNASTQQSSRNSNDKPAGNSDQPQPSDGAGQSEQNQATQQNDSGSNGGQPGQPDPNAASGSGDGTGSDSSGQSNSGAPSDQMDGAADSRSGNGGQSQRDSSLTDGDRQPLGKNATDGERFEALQDYVQEKSGQTSAEKGSPSDPSSQPQQRDPNGSGTGSERSGDNVAADPDNKSDAAPGNETGDQSSGRATGRDPTSNEKTADPKSVSGEKDPSADSADPSSAGSKPDEAAAKSPDSKTGKPGDDPSASPDAKTGDQNNASGSSSNPDDNNSAGQKNTEGGKMPEGGDPQNSENSYQPGDRASTDPSSTEKNPGENLSTEKDASQASDPQQSREDPQASDTPGNSGDQTGDNRSGGEKTGSQPGDSQSGAGEKSGGNQNGGNQPDNTPPGSDQPGQQPQGDPNSDDPNSGDQDPSAQPGSGQPGSGQPGGTPSSKQSGSSGGSGGNNGGAGNQGNTAGATGQTPAPLPPLDAETQEQIEYSRAATDLILKSLEDQKTSPDPKLLDRTGMTQEEFQQFIERWTAMRDAAKTGDRTAQKRYTEALRSLGLGARESGPAAVRVQRDQLTGMAEDGGVNRPPAENAPEFNAFMKARNRVPRNSGDQ